MYGHHWKNTQMSVSTDSGAPLHEEDGYLVPSLSPLIETEVSAEAEEEEESKDKTNGETVPMLLKHNGERNGSLKNSPHSVRRASEKRDT